MIDESPMPIAKVSMIPMDLLEALTDLRRAAEYQVANHPDDTVDWIRNALEAVRAAESKWKEKP